MNYPFIELAINDFSCNPITKFTKEWALVTAGNSEKINTMTVSWGSFGHVWGKM